MFEQKASVVHNTWKFCFKTSLFRQILGTFLQRPLLQLTACPRRLGPQKLSKHSLHLINYSQLAQTWILQSSSLENQVLLPALKILQNTFQNLRFVPRVCKGLDFGLKTIHFPPLTWLLLQLYSNMFIFSLYSPFPAMFYSPPDGNILPVYVLLSSLISTSFFSNFLFFAISSLFLSLILSFLQFLYFSCRFSFPLMDHPFERLLEKSPLSSLSLIESLLKLMHLPLVASSAQHIVSYYRGFCI